MEADSDLVAAIKAASSPNWATRAGAGRQLAARAERPDIAEALRALLLDAHDTAVTDATSQALLQRDDVHGVRPIAQAVASADAEQHDHLYGTIADASRRGARFVDLCLELTHDDDPATRAGAELLVTWIAPDAQHGSPPQVP
ncbi:hypothetical protein [Jiangella muralis]|uniref:hypothetical protein n=1 Tax=Jiangella muralis TaxID=702383 RepID=UPI00069DB4C3|nr:hypothetical protein [Jiangella muralis]